MSLKLLVDECMLNKLLVNQLREAGHDVQTVTDANLLGESDNAVFAHAIGEDRIIITNNCLDFQTLSKQRLESGQHHPGILLVFLYNNPHKDMSVADIIKALANLEESGLELPDQAVSVNRYNY